MSTQNESHQYFSKFSHDFNRELLEVIIDYGSAFVTYRNKIELKGIHFPGRDALIKLVGAANLQAHVIIQICLPLYNRNTRLGCVLKNAIVKTNKF